MAARATTPSTGAGSRSSAARYWIVEDRLRGEREHRYDLRWHLAPEAQGAARGDGDTVLAPGLALVIHGAEHGRARARLGRPEYGVRLDAPVVSAVAEGASARFVTLLAPHAPGEPPPRVRAGDAAGRLRVEIGGARDTIDLGATGCEWERAGVRVSVSSMTALLAPDPAVPQRDALLDERRGRAPAPDRRRGRRL